MLFSDIISQGETVSTAQTGSHHNTNSQQGLQKCAACSFVISAYTVENLTFCFFRNQDAGRRFQNYLIYYNVTQNFTAIFRTPSGPRRSLELCRGYVGRIIYTEAEVSKSVCGVGMSRIIGFTTQRVATRVLDDNCN